LLTRRVGQLLDLCGGDLHPAHLDVGATVVAIRHTIPGPVDPGRMFWAQSDAPFLLVIGVGAD
jgi:hypothetical protein